MLCERSALPRGKRRAHCGLARWGLVHNEGMSEPLDPRPVFTMVMGCNGAGKSARKRENCDLPPVRYHDQDSVAGGLGDTTPAK